MITSFHILAVDYYDGATEGFLVHPGGAIVSYFRLIAWDSQQDERLFVTAEVDAKELIRLEELLRAGNQSPTTMTWIPEWRFSDGGSAAEAEAILERGLERLRTAGQLALGHQPDIMAVHMPVSTALRGEVEEVINRGTPDDIGRWLNRIGR